MKPTVAPKANPPTISVKVLVACITKVSEPKTLGKALRTASGPGRRIGCKTLISVITYQVSMMIGKMAAVIQ